MADKKYVVVNGIYVEKEIFSTYFVCDYSVCKGKCCYAQISDVELGGGGLSYVEAKEINSKRAQLLQYVSPDMLVAAIHPVNRIYGLHYTNLSDNKSCCFSNCERGCCALKIAHSEGVLSFPIPVECAVYPLTVYDNDGNTYVELLHLFDDFCQCAYKKGKSENTKVIDFVKEPLIQMLGEEFFNALKEYNP